MSDLVEREDVIEAIEAETWLGVVECHVDVLMDRIEAIPSIEGQEWIPCSEREPNEFEDVLVLLSDGTMDVLQLTDYLDIWGNVKWCHAVHHGLGCAVSNNDIVAWMPLPEPWKGADDESVDSN